MQRKRLRNYDFTIISNDCWGAEVYKDFNMEYRTPFVGLMLMAPCFIKLIQSMDFYIKSPISFINYSKYSHLNDNRKQGEKKYPIGSLQNEVEIHFLHYSSEVEAKEKWRRRIDRINWNNILIKFDGSKDLCTDEMLQTFNALNDYPMICFLADESKIKSNKYVYVKEWTEDGKKMYKKCQPYFDVVGWLNAGDGKMYRYRKLLYKLSLS